MSLILYIVSHYSTKLFICLLFIVQCTGAAAEQRFTAGSDANTKNLSAALAEADYPPFYFVDDKDRLSGISIDVLEYIAPKLGYSIDYKRLSWPRVLKSLELGSVDMVTTFFNTGERATHVVYTGVPHAVESNHFIALSSTTVTYTGNLSDMESLSIGTIRGYSYGQTFDDADFLKKVPVLDEPTLVRMLFASRFEIAVGNPFAVKLQVKRQGYQRELRVIEPPIDVSPIYMGVSRKHTEALGIAAELTSAIVKFRNADQYKKLLQKYGMEQLAF
ncbi:substrate-binding periplasmic protein [Oleiphilus messinensis]|uniref:substrate-binding periplasmic protein n=1 Tax=Oleiphilus messinensis TaxID=141451 RepID=UPI0012FC42AD|nr:transporter substrate-binding domain-containing protein [Oleiphilus messinensis]